MLPLLLPLLDGRSLVAAQAAVKQFQKLLDQFGGDRENARWQTWQSKLQIYDADQALQQANVVKRSCQSSLDPHATNVCVLQNRVAALQTISAAQKEVFALGDCLHALTLSANGKAAEFAARQGVQLEVFIHRAVWLTGR